MTRKIGEVMWRVKVRICPYQGRTAYSMVAFEQDPRWGTVMRDLREDEVEGEIVQYFEGYLDSRDITLTTGTTVTIKTVNSRVMYEPKVGEPVVIRDPIITK